MKETFITNWVKQLKYNDGHSHLGQMADELLYKLKEFKSDDDAVTSFYVLVREISFEVHRSVKIASNPVFIDCFDIGEYRQTYIIHNSWTKYLDRLFNLLQKIYQVCYVDRGLHASPIKFYIANKLVSPLKVHTGNTRDGWCYKAEIPCNTVLLCEILSSIGFSVKWQTIDMLRIFNIKEEKYFKLLLSGAAKSRDGFAKMLLEYYMKKKIAYHIRGTLRVSQKYLKNGGFALELETEFDSEDNPEWVKSLAAELHREYCLQNFKKQGQ